MLGGSRLRRCQSTFASRLQKHAACAEPGEREQCAEIAILLTSTVSTGLGGPAITPLTSFPRDSHLRGDTPLCRCEKAARLYLADQRKHSDLPRNTACCQLPLHGSRAMSSAMTYRSCNSGSVFHRHARLFCFSACLLPRVVNERGFYNAHELRSGVIPNLRCCTVTAFSTPRRRLLGEGWPRSPVVQPVLSPLSPINSLSLEGR